MVAEAVQETEITQPEAEAPVSPEPVEEIAPAPEPEVEDDFATDVLKELGLADLATPTETGGAAPANETEADPYAGLSAKEAYEKGQKDTEAAESAKTSTKDYQTYVKGVTNSFQSVDADLKAFASEVGLSLDQADQLRQRFANHNGHWKVLHDHTVMQEKQTYQENVRQTLLAAAKRAGIENPEFASIDEYAAKLTEHGQAGHVPESKAKERERDAATKAVAAYRKRLTNAGVDIPGVRAVEAPNNPGNGGGALPSFAAFNNMDITDQEKYTPEQRARIYANDARQRAR